MVQTIPWELSQNTQKKKAQSESKVWLQFKTAAKKLQPSWKLTRLETWSLPGVPDVLILDHKSTLQLVELKYTRTNAVRLSPHQVSFLSSHADGLVWLLVKKDPISAPAQYFLYRGEAVVDVAMKGLTVTPYFLGESMDSVIALISTH